MRNVSLGLIFLFSLVFAGGCDRASSPAAPAPISTEVLMPDFETELNAMAGHMQLSGAELDAVRQAYLERQNGLGEWLAGPGQRLMELEAEMKSEAAAKDRSALQATIAEAKPLREEFQRRIESYDAAIVNVLSPERQLQWQGCQVANEFIEHCAPLALSADQEQYVRGAAVDIYFGQVQRGEANPRASTYLQLDVWAEAQLFSPEQITAYEAVKRDNPLRSLTR